MEVFLRWPGRGSFSELEEPRRSSRPGRQRSKADRRKCRRISHVCWSTGRPINGPGFGWRGLGGRRRGCRWCGKSSAKIFNFTFEPLSGASLFRRWRTPPAQPAQNETAQTAAGASVSRRLRIAITAPADQRPPRAVVKPRRVGSLAAALADRPASGTSVGRIRSAKARARSVAAAAPGALFAWRSRSLAWQEPQSVIRFRPSSHCRLRRR
jgi:hypothetical protein